MGYGWERDNKKQLTVILLDVIGLLLSITIFVVSFTIEIPHATKNIESRYYDHAANYVVVFRNCCLIASVPSIVIFGFFLLSSFNKSYGTSSTLHFALGTFLAMDLFVVGLIPPLKDVFQKMCIDFSNFCYVCPVSEDATSCTIDALDHSKSCFFYDYDYNLVCGANKGRLGLMMACTYTLIILIYVAGGFALSMFRKPEPPTVIIQTTTPQSPQVIMTTPQYVIQQPQIMMQPVQYVQSQPQFQYVQSQPQGQFVQSQQGQFVQTQFVQ